MAWSKAQVKEIFRAAAGAAGLDTAIALAQINQESGFNAGAIGPPTNYGTAKGAAQFIDDTWKRYGSGSPFDPNNAARAYTSFMRELLSRFGGRWDLALAAYNGGPGRTVLQTALQTGKPLKSFPKTATWTNTTVHQQSWNYANLILSAAGKSGAPATSPTIQPAPAPAPRVEAGAPIEPADVSDEDLNEASAGGIPTELILLIAAGAVAYFFFFQDGK